MSFLRGVGRACGSFQPARQPAPGALPVTILVSANRVKLLSGTCQTVTVAFMWQGRRRKAGPGHPPAGRHLPAQGVTC